MFVWWCTCTCTCKCILILWLWLGVPDVIAVLWHCGLFYGHCGLYIEEHCSTSGG